MMVSWCYVFVLLFYALFRTFKGIINFHPMRVISLASGGEKEYYDFISYVAKDKDTGFRETFVFDTGVFSDDVMSTMGTSRALTMTS